MMFVPPVSSLQYPLISIVWQDRKKSEEKEEAKDDDDEDDE